MVCQELFKLVDCSVFVGEKCILAPQNFSIGQGDFITFSGRSGAGKSTLIQVILGFIPPSKGRVYYRGSNIADVDMHALRSEVAVVFQEPVLMGETVGDAVFEPFQYKRNSGLKPENKNILEWFDRFELNIGLDTKLANISGGEKQRVALVRALLLKRDILVLDEVTSALDAEHRQLVFDIIHEVDKTVISVSHDDQWLKESPVNIVLTTPEGAGGEQ